MGWSGIFLPPEWFLWFPSLESLSGTILSSFFIGYILFQVFGGAIATKFGGKYCWAHHLPSIPLGSFFLSVWPALPFSLYWLLWLPVISMCCKFFPFLVGQRLLASLSVSWWVSSSVSFIQPSTACSPSGLLLLSVAVLLVSAGPVLPSVLWLRCPFAVICAIWTSWVSCFPSERTL